jgi:hypothetical protein
VLVLSHGNLSQLILPNIIIYDGGYFEKCRRGGGAFGFHGLSHDKPGLDFASFAVILVNTLGKDMGNNGNCD